MAELVGLPDTETALIQYLKPLLSGVRVSGAVPASRPDRLVVLERTGGTASTSTDEAQLTFQCWDTTAGLAFSLAAQCFALVADAPWQTLAVNVRKVRTLGGVTNFPDPATRNPRYQFTVVVEAARPVLGV